MARKTAVMTLKTFEVKAADRGSLRWLDTLGGGNCTRQLLGLPSRQEDLLKYIHTNLHTCAQAGGAV
jgi:hypothetical protein